jgi:hypothetical protein
VVFNFIELQTAKKEPTMRLVLFLGSGVSLASGLPSVPQIMNRLQRSAFHVDEKGRFQRGKMRDLERKHDRVAQIRSFLRLLASLDKRDRKKAETVFRTTTTYEDLSALCAEMRSWANGQNDNALTTPFLELVERKAGPILIGESRRARIKEICLLAYDSMRFIRMVVANALVNDKPVGLDLILELAESPRISQLDIVTLNHDTLVEHLLTRAGIGFVDGFSDADGDVRWYDDAVYDAAARVRLIKLHGSIDWYEFSRDGKTWPAMLLSGDPATAKDGTGRVLQSWSPNPSFLTGGQKEAWYQYGIYADLHYRFHDILRRADRIVMSGYGWGDIGISNQLDRWLGRSSDKRIILLYENPEALTDRSKILAESYGMLVRRRKLIPVGRWMSDTSLSDIASDIEL